MLTLVDTSASATDTNCGAGPWPTTVCVKKFKLGAQGNLRHLNSYPLYIILILLRPSDVHLFSKSVCQPPPPVIYHIPYSILSTIDPSTITASNRPNHPSIARVKGRSNMYSPPRNGTETSWLNDQSPSRGSETPSLQCKTPENATHTLVNPASTLLQDLLKEQRAHRGSRGAPPEGWDASSIPRSPDGKQEDTGSDKARRVRDISSSGQYVSKINSLNFDLKLEIFHRTRQVGILEQKLERMEEMEEELKRMENLEEELESFRVADKENQSLRETNQRLRKELLIKDKAISEAVEWICKLEGEMETLTNVQKSDRLVLDGPNASMTNTPIQTPDLPKGRLVLDGPDISTPKARQNMFEIPERTSSRRGSEQGYISSPYSAKSPTSREPNKALSFLRADNHSTATLRSLYAPDKKLSHVSSMLTKAESLHSMSETVDPCSPRLSVLSECSEFDMPQIRHFDELEIPVKTSSISGVPPSEQEESKQDQIDRWMQAKMDMSETVIRRRPTSAMSAFSPSTKPGLTFGGDLSSSRPRSRPHLDASLFEMPKLPPTPDTMSTALPNNGSNGSIATRKSPYPDQHVGQVKLSADRSSAFEPVTRPRRSFSGSAVDSVKTNCGDTPRVGETVESPTIFPFNQIANKAAGLDPGTPNNPAIQSFHDVFSSSYPGGENSTTITPGQSPAKTSTSQSLECDSPPLTPQDWVAAAKEGPRSRKDRNRGLRIMQPPTEPHMDIITQSVFHDDGRVVSYDDEPDLPEIPTLDLTTLDILNQSIAEHPIALDPLVESELELDPGPRRRLSFRTRFFNRPSQSGGPRRLQSSPMLADFRDDEDEGAPSPVIPKTRITSGAPPRRPTSQIISPSADIYVDMPSRCDFGNQTLHQPFMEPQDLSMSIPSSSTSISSRPVTSYSTTADHKRHSSLGIFGWMKGISGKRSVTATEKLPDFLNHPAAFDHAANGLNFSRASSPDSMNPPVVRHRSEVAMAEDASRRPRYMGRRSRR
ncbi:hypothetical protein N7495_003768 [Penicillium taxi]|uniref:uncharacterized protein n=1 Tax=Penicillium taxi TaxID=168475 RepID=UPI0025456DC9|nr:uncharacterized protein N7495_003768 [Penicillium taxi]KAJ5899024.1 hypothetical protein N7495_003768 [Penicillium taxi]